MRHLIEILIVCGIVGALSWGGYKYYQNLPSVKIKIGECYSHEWDLVEGEPQYYAFKVVSGDERVFCSVQGDPRSKYFYGGLVCQKRGSTFADSIVIIKCPDWKGP